MKTILLSAFTTLLIIAQPTGLYAFGRIKEERKSFTEEQMIQKSNEFGFKVFRNTAGDGNVLESPISLSIALSMAAGGAANKTEQCMVESLGFKNFTAEEIGMFYKGVVKQLSQADSLTGLNLVNSIWADKKVDVKDYFVKYAAENFSATVKNADFSNPSTVREINQWCAGQTNGKIDRILENTSPDLVMALLNAVYFHGNWNFKFNETSWGDFTDVDGKMSRIDIMYTDQRLKYSENDKFRMVELPYGNGKFVMDVLMVKNNDEFTHYVKALDSAVWEELCSNLKPRQISLGLPKFSMEYDTSLDETLKKLGMGIAFNPEADFSKMSDSPLAIGLVKQKTHIDVMEKGTEAAAISVVGMVFTSSGPVEMTEFIVDRPFIFAIRERGTGAILFLGQKTR